ncbi:MAG: TlpA family protein disulfide reductase [Deltaproteobacteria bacterium]|nr:TlpA family protein disulfide reductase [Deltaproteobacteria bacterium]
MPPKTISFRKPLFRLLLIGLILSLIPLFCACDSGTKKVKVPKTAPDFTLKTLDGQTLTRDGLKGKVVLLDFWATWCPPCRAAIPHLITLYNNYKDQGLIVVGISLDQGDQSDVSDFVKRNQIPYPIAMGHGNPIVKDMGDVTSLPTLIILDQQSEIKFKVVGFNAEIGQKIEHKLRQLLEQKQQ